MRSLLIGAAILASCVAAKAADFPVKAATPVETIYGWTGMYVGIDGGYSAASLNAVDNSASLLQPIALGPIPLTANLHNDMTGGYVGGHFGFDYQMGNWVAGVVTDFQWADMKGSSTLLNLGTVSITGNSTMDAFGTTRVKLGYLVTPVILPYLTGGVAYAHFQNSIGNNIPDPNINALLTSSTSNWRVGYVVGAGVQYALTRNWLLGVEYKHMEFANDGVDFNFASNAFRTPISANLHSNVGYSVDTVGATASYKF